MLVDVFHYCPTGHAVIPEYIKQNLPDRIKSRLLAGTRHFEYGIYVDRSDAALIEEIDSELKIGKSTDVLKLRYVEVDQASLGEFDYYRIHVDDAELTRDVFCEIKRPDCPNWQTCPWGAAITSPIRVHPKKATRIGITQFQWPWQTEIELLISKELHGLFQSEDITGLDYELCEIGTAKRGEENSDITLYVARIKSRGYCEADQIIRPQNWCKFHNTIFPAGLFNKHTPEEQFDHWDFFAIDRVRVRGQEYLFTLTDWIVSRRVVELLLKHKVSGLRPMTYLLKKSEKFVPFLASDLCE